MLSLNGNTAPYLLYAYARIQGIRRKAAETLQLSQSGDLGQHIEPDSLVFTNPEEVVLNKFFLSSPFSLMPFIFS